jgi:cell division protein FtsI/penicillin-binding protein 2
MSESSVPAADQPWRIALTGAVFCALFAVVAVRLHHLQIEKGENLTEMGERQHRSKIVIQAARGNLYDANGMPLAVSDGRWSLFADPGYMDDRLRATIELSRLTGVPREDLRREFESRFNGRRIAKGLDDGQADAIRALKLAGLSLRREFQRVYPEGDLAPHVLGFVLADGRGGAGIEQVLDAKLKGVDGAETITVDAFGQPVLMNRESVAARPGAHVQLTIDAVIQRQLQDALLAAVERHHPKNAAGIVMRPGTGEILAMASWPTFDARDLSQIRPETLRNNALSFVYEPGSTMKPLIAGAVVSDRLAAWTDTFDCEHGAWTYRFGKAVRTIHEKSGGHGVLSMIDGIAFSDNILMAKLGILMGPERLEDWVKRLRFGQRSGLCLPGDEPGIIPGKAAWNPTDACMSVPMGHGVAVTPIQMAFAHAAVANGGMWLAPRLVKRVWTADDSGAERELALPPLAAPDRIYTVENAGQIQNAMTHTMTEGTGKKADLVGWTSAGKTGTTEKLVNGRYSSANNVGSFVCWAPANPARQPELLAMVVIDDPSANGHFGSETAAPVVQKVLQFSLEHLRVPKDQAEPEPDGHVAVGGRRGAR